MSHVTILYPQYHERDYSFAPALQIREDDGDIPAYSIDDPVPIPSWNLSI